MHILVLHNVKCKAEKVWCNFLLFTNCELEHSFVGKTESAKLSVLVHLHFLLMCWLNWLSRNQFHFKSSFLYQSVFAAFLCFLICVCMFCLKKIGQKADCKMLMKLTHGVQILWLILESYFILTFWCFIVILLW